MLESSPGTYPIDSTAPVESSVSAVCWAAIFGGAVAAAAIAIVLVLLGSGLGFATISPWPNSGASAVTFSVAAGVWLIVVQWLSSALGGFLTGRLRTKWVRVHTHEVFFRDTAHGLLTWALATAIGAVFAVSMASLAVGTGARAVSAFAQSGAGNAALMQTRGYDMDLLFRGEKPDSATTSQDARDDAARIFATDLSNGGNVSDVDRAYLADEVASRTGLSQSDARARVDDVVGREQAAEARARQAADAARKSAAAVGIFTALSMLVGAFIASVAAAYGGSLRDEHQ
jgi:hypothetical protein